MLITKINIYPAQDTDIRALHPYQKAQAIAQSTERNPADYPAWMVTWMVEAS